MRTGGGLHFPGELRVDVVGGDGFAFQSTIEKFGGGPLDAPEIMPAGSMVRCEQWSDGGRVGSAWPQPEGCNRWQS